MFTREVRLSRTYRALLGVCKKKEGGTTQGATINNMLLLIDIQRDRYAQQLRLGKQKITKNIPRENERVPKQFVPKGEEGTAKKERSFVWQPIFRLPEFGK